MVLSYLFYSIYLFGFRGQEIHSEEILVLHLGRADYVSLRFSFLHGIL
jgi:hypothetical protein